MKLCEDVQVSLVKRDQSARLDLTARSTWQVESLRSRIGSARIDVGMCPDLSSFVPWVDLVEFHLGGELMMRYLLHVHGRGEVAGVGMIAQLNRRRFPTAETFHGGAHHLWHAGMLVQADAVDPILIAGRIDQATITAGSTIVLQYAAGDSILDMHDDLAGVHVVYAEHGGDLWSWALEGSGLQPGPPIRPSWFGSHIDTRPIVEGAATVNEVLIRYGDETRSVTWPPGGGPDGSGHRLQSPPLGFPEVRTSGDAYLEAETAWELFRGPQLTLGDLGPDPAAVDWEWLVPGRQHISHLAGTEGVVFNLDQVVVSGSGRRVMDVSTRWDQIDGSALRSRVAAST